MVVPKPSWPVVVKRARSMEFPVWKIKASEVPTPDVERRVSVEETAVPPRRFAATGVVRVGLLERTRLPVPVTTSLIRTPP